MQIRNSPSPYVLLIGPAGAGKTTMSKRVVLSTFQNSNYAFFVPLALVDPKNPIDLKYLITLSLLYFSCRWLFFDIFFSEKKNPAFNLFKI